MYESFYGLSRTPFAVTPDPAMLFMGTVHREALATLIYGVETRKGFVVCTGEVGTGKSTIIRAFFDQVRPDAVKLIYIFTPQISPLEMAQYICGELGLPAADSVFAAVAPLQLKLLEEFESGRTVVLMIDEAQLLPPETLEFLRLLSNFETDTEKLIQIVLVGQPEVDALLARRDMRQVNQRVALRARLSPFAVEESFAYIEHRLRVSGAAELAQVMSPSAAWLIAEAAGGIPRCINILADNALISGFGAAQRPLGSQLTGAVIGEFLARSGLPGAPRPPRFGGGWRAARRLRGALAREKGEPAEFAAAAPAPRPALPGAPPRPPHRRSAPVPVVAPKLFEPASAPALVEPTPAPARVEPTPALAFGDLASARALVEPTPAPAFSELAFAPALGEPASAAGIVIIEPVAPAPVLAVTAPAAAAAQLRAAPSPHAAPSALAPRVAAPAGRPPPPVWPPPVQWPALSRVRSGLAGSGTSPPARQAGQGD